MWRLANYIYRAFRNVAAHRCPQDIVVPITTIHNKDDERNREQKQAKVINHKPDFDHIIKNNQFSQYNFEQVEKYLLKFSFQQLILNKNVIKPIEPPKVEFQVKEVQTPSPPSTQNEDSLDSLLQNDEDCIKALKNLSDLNNETMSIINNQSAIEALEAGNLQMGVETLQMSAKDGKNAAALYNLGICYERGIGVEKDRAKACDYYRQATKLGHMDAFINLSILSNHINLNDDDEDDNLERTVTNKSNRIRFSFSKLYKEDPEDFWNDYQYDLTKTLTCIS